MIIATWNINGIKARLEVLIAWLKEANPDVVWLVTDRKLPVIVRRSDPAEPDPKRKLRHSLRTIPAETSPQWRLSTRSGT